MENGTTSISTNYSTPDAAPSFNPIIELSFPLPKIPHTTLHIHLTLKATSTLVFLSTTAPGDFSEGDMFGAGGRTAAVLRPMGSFVYAMPDVSFIVLSPFVCL
jgi:hypothetical protein